ncbi:hypothetical protein Pmar_PMAR002603 [Perkinsus marinus ATCC 50983]|uniref:Uncharacterized protein n=1 Tax=Perkinsus marinus (strain ATCC 50983 / TXsc) TaxID=423536 RepID=C5LJY5_PERM5|nr:hypothetical protein Pmar_PMAR002603 [Perkinsus marinus ATCC 50983]EER02958.1 hypothetical protein Pmar_PMAR002603 [Perkinsus marinus ATCC 50983]|eukprot:XP_002771142.1 hypothetical protein Pmar_PMAR002603 [Perkinsus marinus ATCC 50983]
MSVEWNADDGAPLNSVANDLLEDLTTFTSVAKDINKSELGELVAPPSPLRARLLEELCLSTAPGKGATTESPGEDADICRMVAEGAPIGLLIPVRVNAEWPAVDTDKFGKPKKDEPPFVRWPGEKLEELRLHDWPQGSIPPDMYRLFEELIAKELRLGRLSEINPTSPDCEALSKVHVM